MKLRKRVISKFLLFSIFFLTFMGFYGVIISSMTFIGSGASRFITIPIRILIIIMLVSYFLLNVKELKGRAIGMLYLWFSLFYLLRVFFDFNSLELYYITYVEVFFYFITFSLIPFFVLSSSNLSKEKLNSIFLSFLYSGIFFSVISLISYGQYIGNMSRTEISYEENSISPLILSYNAVMVLGVFLFYLMYNKTTLLKKALLVLGIVLSLIPFILGASRGSLVALFIVLFLNFIYSSEIKSKFKYIIFFIIFLGAIISIDQYFGGMVFGRLFQLEEDIKTGSSSAIRLEIWNKSFNQFLDHPILGDKLAVDGWKNYPHNIILEVLQTTGVVGFIPFFILLSKTIKYAIYIIKYHKNYAWLSVVFILSLVQNMFSGNIYTAAWFWASMALVIAGYNFLKKDVVILK